MLSLLRSVGAVAKEVAALARRTDLHDETADSANAGRLLSKMQVEADSSVPYLKLAADSRGILEKMLRSLASD